MAGIEHLRFLPEDPELRAGLEAMSGDPPEEDVTYDVADRILGHYGHGANLVVEDRINGVYGYGRESTMARRILDWYGHSPGAKVETPPAADNK